MKTIKIHQTGQFKADEGVQRCALCNLILFSLDKKDKKLFKAPARVHHVQNSTTLPIQISAKGWTKGIFLKISPHKIEVTKEKPTCQK
jgi:hypothetical protein